MVLEKAENRKIVFSCFHPDICTMIKMKQNKYPILFLTQGVSEFWPPYDDELTSSIDHAVVYATSAKILVSKRKIMLNNRLFSLIFLIFYILFLQDIFYI